MLANVAGIIRRIRRAYRLCVKQMEEMITDDRKETALRLLKQGVLSNEQIAEGVGLDVKVVNALAEENILQTV